jgi:hypothetical protein
VALYGAMVLSLRPGPRTFKQMLRTHKCYPNAVLAAAAAAAAEGVLSVCAGVTCGSLVGPHMRATQLLLAAAMSHTQLLRCRTLSWQAALVAAAAAACAGSPHSLRICCVRP